MHHLHFLKNSRAKRIASVVAVFFISVPAMAQDLEGRYTLCRIKKEVRTLRVEKLTDGKCKTSYTKFGKDQTIGEAQSLNSCEDVLKKVQETLEKAGWKCRDVKEASVSNLIDSAQ